MTRLPLALVLTLATALPAAAFDPAAMSEAEKTAFGDAVRDYLMENPDVLIESINVLEERRAADETQNDKILVSANADALFSDGHSWVGGNPDGDLTMVEFIDYRCSVCRQVYKDVEKTVADDGNIRLIFKEYPILGDESDLGSRFAVAVKQIAGDEAYKKTHDALMTLRGRITLESLGKLAEELGVDGKAVLDRLNTEAVTAVLRENRQLGERMRIMGTPTFVIGEELLRGVPQVGLPSVVAEIRKQQG